jgi:hypothetical protein
VPGTLTPVQFRVLELYLPGDKTSKQIGDVLGFSRQRADEIIETLRKKVLSTGPSGWAKTRELHPPDSRANPWPPPARRAQQGEFVLRSAILPREDGLELSDGVVPDERVITWTWFGCPRRLGWSWVVSRSRPWSIADTQVTYADWCRWVDAAQSSTSGQPYQLPELGSEPCYGVVELTRTLAWVIGVEGLIYPADEPRRQDPVVEA